MRKTEKLLLILLIAMVVLNPIYVEATELYSLNIDVDLLENGNGNITMHWDYYDDVGTEHYIPISKREIDIVDLQVSKDGRAYEILEDWNVNANFDEKAYKASLRDLGDEYELCWGISSYGSSVYDVSFTVEGMIKNLEDAQFMNYRFVNDSLSEPPEEVNIRVKSFKPFTKEDIKFWGFGMEGNIELQEDGSILFNSNQALDSHNYATILMRFDLGYFDTNYSYPGNFEEIKDVAFQGSIYEEVENEVSNEIVSEPEKVSPVSKFAFFLPFGIIAMVVGSITLVIKEVGKSQKKHRFNIDLNSFKNQYYRDIPYKGRVEDLYFILDRLGLSNYSNYITYYFLKWVRDGSIKVESYEAGIFFKKDKDGFRIVSQPKNMGKMEEEFFGFMVKAAGDNGLLEANEFNTWMSKNTSRFETFISDLSIESEDRLFELGYIEYEEQKGLFKSSTIDLTKEGRDLAENLIRFKNYLYDFSLLNERESINVMLWDNLMLYAAIYGITDRVHEEFEKLYPNYTDSTMYNSNVIYISHMYSRGISNSYQSAISASTSASSGFGGGTGFGGGGGSFGGGSGGGTR